MFPSTGLLFLRLADDFDYCSVICTAFAAFYVWNTFLGVRVRVERARVKGPVNALCRCYVCVLNICSSLALFPPSMWPTLIINFKLLSSWSEKRLKKACERTTLNLFRQQRTLRHYQQIHISRYQFFHAVSFPLYFFAAGVSPCSLRLSPSRQQMLHLCPDVLSLLVSNHVFPKFSYSKHLQRCLLSSAATDGPRG